MRLAADGTLRLSPTDLANHLACPHLTQLELRVQRGERVRFNDWFATTHEELLAR